MMLLWVMELFLLAVVYFRFMWLSLIPIAGALVQANAETLSAVVLPQIINPGCPIIYAPSYGGIMDMRVASHAFGTPE